MIFSLSWKEIKMYLLIWQFLLSSCDFQDNSVCSKICWKIAVTQESSELISVIIVTVALQLYTEAEKKGRQRESASEQGMSRDVERKYGMIWFPKFL